MNIELFKKDQLTKGNLKSFVEAVKFEIAEGNLDGIDVACFEKYMTDLIKEMKSVSKESAIDDFDNNGGKVMVKNGFEITKVEKKPTLDYSQDDEWVRLDKAKKQREEDLKNSYRLFERGDEYSDNDEVIPVVSLKKNGSTYLKMTYK
jgi:hypothetical protein